MDNVIAGVVVGFASASDAMNVNSDASKDVPLASEDSETHMAKRSRKRSRRAMSFTTTSVPARTPARPRQNLLSPCHLPRTSGLGSPMVISPAIYSSPAHNTRSATKLRANVWRNPSILGGGLKRPWWEEGEGVVSLRLYFDYTERIRGEGDG